MSIKSKQYIKQVKGGNSYIINNSKEVDNYMQVSSSKSSTNKLKTSQGINNQVVSMRHSYKISSHNNTKQDSKTLETDQPPQSFKMLSDKLKSQISAVENKEKIKQSKAK